MGCFSCKFSSKGSSSISFLLPSADINRNASDEANMGEKEAPKEYEVTITYADGKVVYSGKHDAGENVIVPELNPGKYSVDVKGESKNYIFIGKASANVLGGEECVLNINIEQWKKGQIKIDFSKLSFEDGKELDFKVEIIDSLDEVFCSRSITLADKTEQVLLEETLPVGTYKVKLTGGNPVYLYTINNNAFIPVSEGHIYVCSVREKTAAESFVSANGSDTEGTGESDKPFKSVNRALEVLGDTSVPVTIVISDNVVEENPVVFNNPKFKINIKGQTGSSLVLKKGMEVIAGTVTFDDGLLISGNSKVTVGSGCTFVIKLSGKVADDSVVFLKSSAVINLEDKLTSDKAAVVEMELPKNKTAILKAPADKDYIQKFHDKFSVVNAQSYEIDNSGKAMAKLPDGYIGIDSVNSSITSNSTLKVFVDDYSELTALGTAIKGGTATGITLYLQTNPKVDSIDKSFNGIAGLKAITIPSTIKTIGDNAFAGCTGLSSVTIANSVTSIGAGAFDGCTSLASVTIPSSVENIGNSAFNGCSKLSDVSINGNIEIIGNSVFANTGLESIKIPATVTKIGERAFANCISLASINIPASVENIGIHAFEGCSGLTTVTLHEGLETIGAYSFMNTGSINKVTVPNSVKAIGASAFDGSNINGIVLGNGITSIGNGAFQNCSQLTGAITIPDTILQIMPNTFAKTGAIDVTISENVLKIGEGAFSGSKIVSISIPKTLNVIDTNAFSGCNDLKSNSIDFKDKVTIWDGTNGNQLDPKTPGTSLSSGTRFERPLTLGEATKIISNNRDDLKLKVSINSDTDMASLGKLISKRSASDGYIDLDLRVSTAVTTLGKDVFGNCERLRKITIPEGITTIGYQCFANSYSLEEIAFPGSLTKIENRAFMFSKLERATFVDSTSPWTISNGSTYAPGTPEDNATALKDTYKYDIWTKQ